jgi:Domain of unknown function (DUF4331)
MILNVDGFLEPSNGPNYFPFDPNVRYVMNVDNNRVIAIVVPNFAREADAREWMRTNRAP